MAERSVHWLVYTCLLGLIPVFARLLVWNIVSSGVTPVAISDLVAFGLVLHSANINEVNETSKKDAKWKIVHNGLSVIFIVFYALLLFATIAVPSDLNKTSLLNTTIGLSIASFVLSCLVFMRRKSLAGAVS